MQTKQLAGILNGEWLEGLSEFMESKQFDDIISFIREEKVKGKNIQPTTDRIFRALNLCKPDNIKVIMAAQDPYNALRNNMHIADGLAFSCSLTKNPQPSLRNIYSGITKTVGESQMKENNWDLEYLARQGVLLINSTLTVRTNEANSHKGLWDKFIAEMFHKVVNKSSNPIVYILLGKEAQNTFQRYARLGDYIVTAVHPAAAAYTGGVWDCNDVFSKCNRYLELNQLTPINW